MNQKTKTYKKHKRKHNKTKKHKFIKGGMKKGEIMRDAIISDDSKYRYQLSRIWDKDKPTILFMKYTPLHIYYFEFLKHRMIELHLLEND